MTRAIRNPIHNPFNWYHTHSTGPKPFQLVQKNCFGHFFQFRKVAPQSPSLEKGEHFFDGKMGLRTML